MPSKKHTISCRLSKTELQWLENIRHATGANAMAATLQKLALKQMEVQYSELRPRPVRVEPVADKIKEDEWAW